MEYLQGVYQGRLRFEPHRFRAANAALPFESPKLAVAAVIHPDGSFAERLEKAIERSASNNQPPKLIEAQPAIEHSANELTPASSARSFIRPRRRISKI